MSGAPSDHRRQAKERKGAWGHAPVRRFPVGWRGWFPPASAWLPSGRANGDRGEGGQPTFLALHGSNSCRDRPGIARTKRRARLRRMLAARRVSTKELQVTVTCGWLTRTMGVAPRCGPDAGFRGDCSRRGSGGPVSADWRSAVSGAAARQWVRGRCPARRADDSEVSDFRCLPGCGRGARAAPAHTGPP